MFQIKFFLISKITSIITNIMMMQNSCFKHKPSFQACL